MKCLSDPVFNWSSGTGGNFKSPDPPNHYHNAVICTLQKLTIDKNPDWHILQGPLQSSNTNPILNPHIPFHFHFRKTWSCASMHVTCPEHYPKTTNVFCIS